MIRVKKSYSSDKMFAVILVIIIISLFLIKLTVWLERKIMPWTHLNTENGNVPATETEGDQEL